MKGERLFLVYLDGGRRHFLARRLATKALRHISARAALSDTSNQTFDLVLHLFLKQNNHMMSHEVLAAFHGNDYSTIYDDKTAAALGAAMLEANGFELSPELIDAVTPFLAANMQYNPMVAENDSPAVEMQFFPDVNDFDAQPNGLKVQPMDDFYANTSAPQIPFPNVAIKRSGDLEAEGPSSFEDSDESDEEYQEPGRKAGSKRPLSGCKSGQKTGANAAAKKPRTRPPNADDILLHTDPALVEKMLVPVRKRRQPKTMDPSLPPEVGRCETWRCRCILMSLEPPRSSKSVSKTPRPLVVPVSGRPSRWTNLSTVSRTLRRKRKNGWHVLLRLSGSATSGRSVVSSSPSTFKDADLVLEFRGVGRAWRIVWRLEFWSCGTALDSCFVTCKYALLNLEVVIVGFFETK